MYRAHISASVRQISAVVRSFPPLSAGLGGHALGVKDGVGRGDERVVDGEAVEHTIGGGAVISPVNSHSAEGSDAV